MAPADLHFFFAGVQATPIWKVGPVKTDLGPQASAKKCIAKWEKDKPCADGAGIKWDAKALGVKAAETKKCAQAGRMQLRMHAASPRAPS